MSEILKNNHKTIGKTPNKKPILLCILDGWGIGDESSHNAILRANTPNYQQILANYPHSELATSGLDVGLPEGQMGNSEVGHICIGSGRIIYQDLPRVNNAIKDGSLKINPNLQKLIANCQKANNVCHLMGLLSDGGVHSHQDHLITLAQILAQNNIAIKLHCFLDGRDTAQKSAITYLQNLQTRINDYPNIKITTVSGRYYAMDRDKNWNRVQLAHSAMVDAAGPKSIDAIDAVEKSYQNNITDEFILPTVIGDYSGMKDGDALLSINFRADRIREISDALLNPQFNHFAVRKIKFCGAASLTEYSEELNSYFDVLFPSVEINNSLGEILANLGLKQLRIAETEKYAHITFFFSGGREKEFVGEKRILIKSPNVATYDLMPEMSALEVTKKLVEAINSDEYDFIVVNYANPDMVGHSGNIDAAIKACQTIDTQLGILRDNILAIDGMMIISADHGNIENMVDEKGNPHTTHTTNPVPFILIGNHTSGVHLKNGRLCDIAPTILGLMNITQPLDMTGANLITK